jgi:hypothetical protein
MPPPRSLAKCVLRLQERASGEMAEWLKAHAWKACVRETVPWVRIPLSPPAYRSWIFSACVCVPQSPIGGAISVKLRSPSRRGVRIFLRIVQSSLKLWTSGIRYGSGNSSVSKVLRKRQRKNSAAPLGQATAPPRFLFAILDVRNLYPQAVLGGERVPMPEKGRRRPPFL